MPSLQTNINTTNQPAKSFSITIHPSFPFLAASCYRSGDSPRGVVVGDEERWLFEVGRVMGELFRYRCESFSSVFALRCIYYMKSISLASWEEIAANMLYCDRDWLREGIPDSVTSSQSDPLRNRSVLLLGSRELLLRTEGLVAL